MSRSAVLAKVVSVLEGITIDGGYSTDAGKNVFYLGKILNEGTNTEFEWNLDTIQDEQYPCILVLEGDRSYDIDSRPNAHYQKLQVDINIYAAPGAGISDVRKMMADVYKAIRLSENLMLAELGLVRMTPVADKLSVFGEEGGRIDGCQVVIDFEWTSSRWTME